MVKKKTRRRRSSQSAAVASVESVIGNIDLLTEILLRVVPAESLIRFKSVSKQWHSLISSSSFAIAHFQRNNNNYPVHHILYREPRRPMHITDDLSIISLDGGSSSFPSLSCLDNFRKEFGHQPVILHCCHGLILCKHGLGLIVLNPTTQKYRPLPYPLIIFPPSYSRGSFLAFEPLKSLHYKVVLLSIDYPCRSSRVRVFSSKGGSWDTNIGHESKIVFSPEDFTWMIFWNGGIHWINKDNSFTTFDVDAKKILQNILPPLPNTIRRLRIRYFGGCNDRLFLIQSEHYAPRRFRILEIDRDSNTWVIRHHVDLSHLDLPPIKRLNYRVLYVESVGNKEDISLVLVIGRKVVSYEVIKNGQNCTNAKVANKFGRHRTAYIDPQNHSLPIQQSLVSI